jgi:SAM-dependent methyltransferase
MRVIHEDAMGLHRIGERHRRAELMDQPGLDPSAHAEALRSLKRINVLSNSAGILWGPIRDLAGRLARPVRVLDIACGGGDVLRALSLRAKRDSIALDLAGCDKSAVALDHAKGGNGAFRLFPWDALHDPLPGEFDVVMTSLFLHHLDNEDAVLLLRRMKEMTGSLLLVNDLERGPLGWLLAWAGARILSRSPIVHFDGPVSVEGAFTCAEVRRLARRAGLSGATVKRCWPCRYLLAWRRIGNV